MKTLTPTFEQFDFSPEILKAIKEMGFETPTPIQLETLPILLKKPTDFLGLAATGTGKTAAFGIPLLEGLDQKAKGVQALILCPTRELAKQTSEQINLLARHLKTKAIAIYGGSDYGGQLRALKEGVAIVVGTPGRIIDHLERKTLNLNHLNVVVLDEADEMISMGFKEEIEFILQQVSQKHKHQTWLFSATMSREIRKISDTFLTDPEQIQINKSEKVAHSVKQFFYQLSEYEKPEVICRVIDQVPGFYGLIFCQTKALVTDLTANLKNSGYKVDCLHGDMEQNARERTMKAFKAKQVNIVVCTDVASRGIDVKDLTHVINYSLPRELDLYIHRIGRTGRGGKEGIALSLVTPSHIGLVKRIESVTQSKMTKIPVPEEKDVLQIKIARSTEEFTALPVGADTAVDLIKGLVLKTEWADAIENMSKEEIVARFLVKNLKFSIKPERAKEVQTVATGRSFLGGERRDRDHKGRSDHKDHKGGRREFKEYRGKKDHKEHGKDHKAGGFHAKSSFKPSTRA